LPRRPLSWPLRARLSLRLRGLGRTMRSPGRPSWQRARGAPPGPREPRPALAAGAPAPPLPGPPSCAPTRRPRLARPRASAAPLTAPTRLRGGSRSWPALAAPRAAATPPAPGGQAPARPLLPAPAQAAPRRPHRTISRRALGPERLSVAAGRPACSVCQAGRSAAALALARASQRSVLRMRSAH